MADTDGPAPGPRSEEPTGVVVVLMSPDVAAHGSDDLREYASENKLDRLGALLDEIGRPANARSTGGRHTAGLPVEAILELERRAADSPFPPLRSLTRYWELDVRDTGVDPTVLARRLAELPGVAAAYPETAASDPSGPALDAGQNPNSARQCHLDPAPLGIDARWAWTRDGGTGAAIALADVEQGWRLDHPDLVDQNCSLAQPINRDRVGGYVGDHGTSALAVVAAVDNRIGGIGIAPTPRALLACSTFDGTLGLPKVALAVAAAALVLRAGDVILLEVQRAGTVGLPTEIDLRDLDAIRLASGVGITVVEPAGNGPRDLDAWDPGDGRTLDRQAPGFVDSGAVLVGACAAALTGDGHARSTESNFGSRIDCHAWGEGVVTAAADGWTDGFSGTSSAAAIVAGAAVLVQAMHTAAHDGTVLTPLELRALLADPANGTPQADATTGRLIGAMPDLRAIADAIGAQELPTCAGPG